MLATSDPNLLIGELAFTGMMAVFFHRLILWVRDAPVTPDPWDADTEKKLSEPETRQTCQHCSTPQNDTDWFCPHCGNAVGTYNNLMPYVCLFSSGEVLRNGVTGKVPRTSVTIFGYLFFSLINYLVFAPIYWFLLVKNLAHHKKENGR